MSRRRDKSVIGRAHLEIRLLGHPEVCRDGRPVPVPTRNTLLLVARLAVGGLQSREVLASLLWPEADGWRGRTNLRRTLAYLRDACGRDLEVILHQGDALALSDAVTVDVHEIRRALNRPITRAALQRAVDLWRGAFMEGIEASGEELDNWLLLQRESWQQSLVLACERLVNALSEAGDIKTALAADDRWLTCAPASEAAHRERIRLHLIRGDRSGALQAYAHAVDVLARELGVAPSSELEALADMARRDVPTLMKTRVAPPSLPMVGRQMEHALLTTAFSRAVAREPSFALITGEAGIGKSRLLTEFIPWVSAHRAHVREARAYPSVHRVAYGAVATMFAEALPRTGRSRARGRSQLDVAQAVSDLVVQLSVRSALVLVMDDLQWVDPDSLELLTHVATAARREGARLVLVAAVRDDELAASIALRDWLARIVRSLSFVEVVLRPLTEEQSDELARAFSEDLSPDAVNAMRVAAGRPLLILESLRFLAETGDPHAIAPAAREFMEARLRGLSPPAAALAEAAAVIEQPAELSALRTLSRLSDDEAQAAIEELATKHILAGGGHHGFSHELLRRAVYAAIPGDRRRALHAAAAGVLEPVGPPSEVARHAELAGALDIALRFRIRAAAEALSLSAYRVAADQLRSAIAIRPDDAHQWLELGRAEELAGRSDLAAETYRRLVERGRRSGDSDAEAAALVRLAELAGRDVGVAPPTDLLEEAAEAAREAANAVLESEALLVAAQGDAYRGRLAEAQARLDVIEGAARRLEHPPLIARCLNLRAFINQERGAWQEALAISRQAQVAYRSVGDQIMALDSKGYELAALVFLGEWRTAMHRARRALVTAERLANPWAIANVSLVCSWALRDGGMLQEARAMAEHGRAAAVEAGFAPLQVLNAAIEGRCLREQGDITAAVRSHLSLADESRSMEGVAYQCLCEELCADHAAAGDWPAATHWAAEAVGRWCEVNMFAHLSLWTVLDAMVRSGKRAVFPSLPETPRYDVVRLRAQAVLEGHEGKVLQAIQLQQEALTIAERLELAIEAAELRDEITGASSNGAGRLAAQS